MTKNILNQTENIKKPIKLENSVEKRRTIKPENLSAKNIKLEDIPIISDIKPSQRKSKRIKNKSRLRAAAPYKKSFSPPKIAWEFT